MLRKGYGMPKEAQYLGIRESLSEALPTAIGSMMKNRVRICREPFSLKFKQINETLSLKVRQLKNLLTIKRPKLKKVTSSFIEIVLTYFSGIKT